MYVIHFLECDEHHPCQGLGEHAHFRSFGMAFLTLFRIATGILTDNNRFHFITQREMLKKISSKNIIIFFFHFISSHFSSFRCNHHLVKATTGTG